MRKTRFWPTSPPFPVTSPVIRITSSLVGVLSFRTAVMSDLGSRTFTFICTYLCLSRYAFYDCTQVKAHMAATKLTHATGNIFMEQSSNDCLYSLGSTVTLASSTALSNVFSFSSDQARVLVSRCQRAEPPCRAVTSSLHLCHCRPGLSWWPSHQAQGKDGNRHCSSCCPTTLHASPPCAVVSRTNLRCLHNSSISPLPSQHLAVSQRHLHTKPLPVPGRRERT